MPASSTRRDPTSIRPRCSSASRWSSTRSTASSRASHTHRRHSVSSSIHSPTSSRSVSAPAILAFTWGLWPLERLGWAAGFLYVTAAAMRLARFNVQSSTTTASTDKRYFVGMPSPAAASVIASTVYLYPYGLQERQAALPALAMVLVPAFLMVSTIRFRSVKAIDVGWRTILLHALSRRRRAARSSPPPAPCAGGAVLHLHRRSADRVGLHAPAASSSEHVADDAASLIRASIRTKRQRPGVALHVPTAYAKNRRSEDPKECGSRPPPRASRVRQSRITDTST